MNDINLYEKVPLEEKNFPITLLEDDTRFGLAAHWHEHIELLYFKRGGFQMTCNGYTFDVKDDNIVVVNSNELHFFDRSTRGRYFCIMINPAFFNDIKFDNIIFKNLIIKDDVIKQCFEEMFFEYLSKNEGYDMAIKAIAYRLMTHILRNYKSESLSDYDFKQRKSKILRIDTVLTYISDHYDDKLTTALLAEKFFLNEYYFCHFFKKATGQSPVSYINRYRIEKAATLLKNTDISITELAMNVGFDDPNYFTRTFKKYLGVTPSVYKNSN